MWFNENKKLLDKEKKYVKNFNVKNKSSLRFINNNNEIILTGKLRFTAIYKNDFLEDEYNVEIHFPENYPSEFPFVKEVDNKIDKNYHHSYNKEYDKRFLCLATDSELSLKFSKDPCLRNFFKNCLIPYLYIHSFKTKYNKNSEMEERPHGVDGILNFYYNYFDVQTPQIVLKFLYYCFNTSKITENTQCPCGSNISLMKCHYFKLVELNQANIKYIYSDYNKIEENYQIISRILKMSLKNKFVL
ncbi:MAG: hypothetical protein P9L89_00795 [Candidatus Celaenobacter polaris]|nr:hypothetical protein [Candidatus Celaenobacter polaris]